MSKQDFEGSNSTGDVEWGTPPEIYNPLDEEFHFEFDLAATSENTKCSRFFTKHDNALIQDWPRTRCWLNPPYSRSVGKWIKKAYEESSKGTTSVILIRHNSSGMWYHRVAVPHAHEIRPLMYRVGYLKDGVPKPGAYYPSVVLVFKGDGSPVPVRKTCYKGRFGYVSF